MAPTTTKTASEARAQMIRAMRTDALPAAPATARQYRSDNVPTNTADQARERMVENMRAASVPGEAVAARQARADAIAKPTPSTSAREARAAWIQSLKTTL